MYEKYGDQVYFVLINLIEPEKEATETADRYITQGEYTLPYYYDMTTIWIGLQWMLFKYKRFRVCIL